MAVNMWTLHPHPPWAFMPSNGYTCTFHYLIQKNCGTVRRRFAKLTLICEIFEDRVICTELGPSSVLPEARSFPCFLSSSFFFFRLFSYVRLYLYKLLFLWVIVPGAISCLIASLKNIVVDVRGVSILMRALCACVNVAGSVT